MNKLQILIDNQEKFVEKMLQSIKIFRTKIMQCLKLKA